MASIDIDKRVSNPAYTNKLGKFQAFRASMRKDFKLYFKLSHEQQLKWRAKDPLLDQVLNFCHKVEILNNDD